jgi:hypothetical protein
MPPMANDGQQGGVVPQGTPTPDVSPTPTGTPAVTPSPTPSSTPYILPETPALWYDATNIGSIDYISSGGTDYVATWRSVGTYQKAVTGVTTNTMPIWSGSSQMPGSPLVVRWNKSTNTALRQFLTQRFDSTPIPQSGFTTFVVFANPGYDYLGLTSNNGLGFQFFMASGNTTGGFNTPAALNYNLAIGLTTNIQLSTTINGVGTNNVIPNWSATSLNNKFLYTQVSQFDNNIPYFELNQSGGTMQLPITGTTNGTVSSIALGIQFIANGTINFATINPGVEIGEIMMFNRILTIQEQEQVQDYLRDKWRYDEWASPVPTPTPTDTPNPTVTPTNTNTPTQTGSPTPSATPAPFSPSGLTDLQQWYISTSGASTSSWDNQGLLGGSVGQGTGSQQPQIISSTLGSFSGNSVQFTSRDNMSGGFTSTNYSSSTVFSVMKVNGTDATGWSIDLFSPGPDNAAWSWQSRVASNTSIARKNPGSSTSPARTIAPLLLASSGTTGSFFTASYNDTLGTSGTTTFTGTTANSLQFGYDPGSSSSTNIEMFEFLIYNRVLTSGEYSQVMDYLKTKYQYNTW